MGRRNQAFSTLNFRTGIVRWLGQATRPKQSGTLAGLLAQNLYQTTKQRKTAVFILVRNIANVMLF